VDVSYLAIARKYRPATFDEIVGQDHVTRTLRNAIANQRIHHAFLFTGARGVGKTTAARALARSLNCAKGPSATPCGTCTSCIEISSGRNPDLIEIDGASNNSVDDVREIREAVRYAPTQGRWKIYLIDEVHMLSKGAFNALLKTLEEPPSHVLFIFATTEPNRIPDTILSRVQRFDFKRIPVPIIMERLAEIAGKEGVEISSSGLRMIARGGEGSMRDAQSLLDQVISFAGSEITDDDVIQTLGLIERDVLYDMLEGLVTAQPDRCLELIDSVYSHGHELARFTEELLDVIRNATFLLLSEQSQRFVDLPEAERQRLGEITENLTGNQLSRLFNALLEVHDQVSRAARPRIILEMAIAHLADTRPLQPIDHLLDRLDDLEKRLRHRAPEPSPSGGGGRSRPVHRRPNASPRSPSSSHNTTSRSTPPAPPTHNSAIQQQPKALAAAPEPTLESTPSPEPIVTPPEPDVEPTPKSPPHLVLVPPVDDDTPPPAAPPEQRWESFCLTLKGRDKGVSLLLTGEPQWSKGCLTIGLTAGIEAARGKRASTREDVKSALVACYGPDATLEIRSLKPLSASLDDDQLAQQQQAQSHPTIARLIEELGATIEVVTPHNNGESN